MNFTLLFEKMGLEQEGVALFDALHSRMDDPAFADAVRLAREAWHQSDEAFGTALSALTAQQQITPEEMTLYLYLLMSEDLLALFREKGMPEQVFYDTMRSIADGCRFCRDKTGIYGITQQPHRAWFRRQFTGRLYRFGRLEFELYPAPMDMTVEGVSVRQGDLCLNTHIPRYLRLEEAACEEAYARARTFFRTFFGMETCVFLCESWLTHPWLGECLKPDSLIVRFQKHYTVLRTTQSPDSVIKWVFPKKCENIGDYPEDTGLQRLVKHRLQENLPLGIALGARL